MSARPGLVGEANGGVLFLDEIGELPPELHPHLLRVLDVEGEYRRLGDATPRRSDFRMVAATNRAPSELKHDLVPRFGLQIALPSLRERREDVPLLARALLLEAADKEEGGVSVRRFVREVAGRREPQIASRLMDALVRLPYTTNVREIGNALRASMAEATGDVLTLPERMRAEKRGARPVVVAGPPSQHAVLTELLRHNRNVTRVANALGARRVELTDVETASRAAISAFAGRAGSEFWSDSAAALQARSNRRVTPSVSATNNRGFGGAQASRRRTRSSFGTREASASVVSLLGPAMPSQAVHLDRAEGAGRVFAIARATPFSLYTVERRYHPRTPRWPHDDAARRVLPTRS
jgi:transcriptional regulator with GAF, ATPase, and Fis domain